MTLGERVRYVREEVANMKRAEFAETIRITSDQLNNIERDRLRNPSTKKALFELICNKYSINYEWLVNEEGEMKRTLSENKQFIDFMYQIQKLPDDAVSKKFIYGLSKMDLNDLEKVLGKINELLK